MDWSPVRWVLDEESNALENCDHTLEWIKTVLTEMKFSIDAFTHFPQGYDAVEADKSYKLDEDRILHWLKEGAQPSEAAHGLMKRSGLAHRWHLTQQGLDEKTIEDTTMLGRMGYELKKFRVCANCGRKPTGKRNKEGQCCDKYNNLNRRKNKIILNMKIKQLSDCDIENQSDIGSESDDE